MSDPISLIAYKPGWRFRRGGPGNRYLCIFATTPDSSAPEQTRCTQHMFEIPDDLGSRPAFARWTFARLLDVERHEAGEFFTFDRVRPFFPAHSGGDPYAPADHCDMLGP